MNKNSHLSAALLGLLATAGALHGATNLTPLANATAVDPGSVAFDWSAASGDVEFLLYVGTTSSLSIPHRKAHTTLTAATCEDLEPNSTYYWRVDAYDASGTMRDYNGDGQADRGTVWTFQTGPGNPLKAHTPVPADGATVTSTSGNVLQWSTPASEASFNIYFGKDSSPDETEYRGNLTGNPTALSYFAGALEPSTRYYWRIDTITGGSVVPGRVWDFTTGPAAVTYTNPAAIIFADEFENGLLNEGPQGWTRDDTRAQLRTLTGRPGQLVKLSQVTWIERRFSTEGMQNIQLRYHRQLSGYDAGEALVSEWSVDGVTWNTLASEQTGAFTDALTVQNCAAGANDRAEFRVRFRTNASDTNEYALIDSIQVRGERIPFAPPHDPVLRIHGAKVIFLGDSLTSNTGSLRTNTTDEKEHWTDRLQQRFNLDVLTAHPYDINDNDPTHRLLNHGKGGTRAFTGAGATLPSYYGDATAHPDRGGYQRLRYALEVENLQPKFVFINFGMNDHKRVWKSGVSTEQCLPDPDFRDHLNLIIDLVRNHTNSDGSHPVPILVAPHAFYQGAETDLESYYSLYSPTLFANAADGYSALGRFARFITEVRNAGDDSLVDVIEVYKAARDYDPNEFTVSGGVHLDTLGHTVYARVIGDFLEARYGP